jgi:hypothetical protein
MNRWSMTEHEPHAKLIDAFLAAVRCHGLDAGQAVEFLATCGLQRPAIGAAAIGQTLPKTSEAA